MNIIIASIVSIIILKNHAYVFLVFFLASRWLYFSASYLCQCYGIRYYFQELRLVNVKIPIKQVNMFILYCSSSDIAYNFFFT